MATILSTCSDHGDVEMTEKDIIVRVCKDNGQGAYTFRCPEDGVAINKPADIRVVELLIASGCELQRWSLPKELDERPAEGDPIDHDYLLELHEVLTDENKIALAMGELIYGKNTTEGTVTDIPPDDGPRGDIKNV